MDVNFELYKIFYIAARLESFSAAARELFISQSAVSQSIKKLEQLTGSKLFVRGRKSVTLTSIGRMLYNHAEQAYNLLKSAEGKIQEMQQLEMGELSIGVGDTILRYLLLPCLQKFINMYPGIKVRIINRTSPGIIQSIKSSTVDIGIVTLPADDDQISVAELCCVEDVFVASSRFSNLRNIPVTLDLLSQLPLLLLQKQSSTRHNLDLFFASKGISIVPEIELESMDLLVELSKIGLGVAHVLKECAAGPVERNELFILDTVQALPPRKLGIVTLKNVPLSPAAETFAAALRQFHAP